MHLWMGDVRDFLHIPADLLVANLHFQVIDQITDEQDFYSKRFYILSGLLGHEGHFIEEKLMKKLHLLDRHEENFWFTYLLKR
jgi:ribosomal protein L11 methyltransferase